MSIKIYEGLKTDITDIYRLNKLFQNYKSIILEEFHQEVLRNIGKTMARRHDRYVFGFEDEEPELRPMKIMYHIADRCREAQSKGERDPEFDYSCHVRYYPSTNKILMLVSAEKRFYYYSLRDMPEVSKYGYWDSTDKDEEVSDSEWEQSRKDWDVVRDQFPLSFLLFDSYEFPFNHRRLSDAEDYIPSDEYRARGIASDLAIKRRFEGVVKPNAQEIVRYATSKEFLEYRQEILEEVKDRLTDISFYRKMTS